MLESPSQELTSAGAGASRGEPRRRCSSVARSFLAACNNQGGGLTSDSDSVQGIGFGGLGKKSNQP